MPTIAHYEVYTLEDAGWVLHARYMNSEKTRALDEARTLEVDLGRPTKVMRESYDTETNHYGEQTVFLSRKALDLRQREQNRRRRRGGAGADHETDLDETGLDRPTMTTGPIGAGFRPNAQIPAALDRFSGSNDGRSRFGAPTHARSTGDLLVRILFVLTASLVIATAGAAMIPIIMHMLRAFDVVIDSRSWFRSMSSVFLILFLLSNIALTLRIVPLQGVKESPKRRRGIAETRDTAPAPSAPPAIPGDGPRTAENGPTDAGAAEGLQKSKITEKDIEKEKEHQKIEKQETEKSVSNKEKAEDKHKSKKKEQQSSSDHKDQKDHANHADAAPPTETTPEPPPTPAFQAGHATTMVFLSAYVAALKDQHPKLDTYNRFGINLYLAGACEAVARAAHFNPAEFHRLLRETVEVMGTHAAQATSFVERLDTYLAEDRYAQMVRCGREAMILHQSGTDNAFATLGMVLEDWNTPRTQKITGSTIAIVFTDMVGSTDLTSEHGDIKAQQILRAHNAAVRSALARFNGREVKHTGDGIMATFEHVPDAVWGMIDTLTAVRVHNQAEPEIPLRIRIGINAGEPISAENDYYGLAVTVAARVCARAEMDEIIVTQIVRDMCEGTRLVFEDRGTTFLKGIKEPHCLHEAVWDGAPSHRQHDGSTTVDTEPDGGSPDAGPSTLPTQPGGGHDHPGGAVVDPDAEGWGEPRLDETGAPVAADIVTKTTPEPRTSPRPETPERRDPPPSPDSGAMETPGTDMPAPAGRDPGAGPESAHIPEPDEQRDQGRPV